MDCNTMGLRRFQDCEVAPDRYEELPSHMLRKAEEALMGAEAVIVDSAHKELTRWAKRKRAKRAKQKETVNKCNDYYANLRRKG